MKLDNVLTLILITALCCWGLWAFLQAEPSPGLMYISSETASCMCNGRVVGQIECN